jgi:phage-related protein
MRSIVFAGVDFSEFCAAEVAEKVALPLEVSTMAVPGRAGALLVSGRIAPRVVRVRLFVDAGFKPGTAALADVRHRVYAALGTVDGGELRLPDEPELAYRNAVCTGCGTWSSLFEDGNGTVDFALLDPVAYGAERREAGVAFSVGGTWRTWPVFEVTASAGAAVEVGHGGQTVRVEREFAGGEVVRIDCENERVEVDGTDARSDVALSSDFFCFEPGERELSLIGCASCTTTFSERWL